jgi:exosortase/archaeosortase family protein
VVRAEGFSVRIIPECTAFFSCALFLSFVLACPASIRKKALGLSLGIPLLALANLARLLLVFWAGLYDRDLFEATHVYLGQVFTVALVCLTCLAWLKWPEGWPVSGETGKGPPFRAILRFGAISLMVCIIWFAVNRPYMWLVDQVVASEFSLFGWNLVMPRVHAVYPQTFSIVAFVSMVLATGPLTVTRKAKGILVGVVLLMVAHILHRTCNALMTGFMMPAAGQVAVTLSTLTQYLLPFVLWWAVSARPQSPGDVVFESCDGAPALR